MPKLNTTAKTNGTAPVRPPPPPKRVSSFAMEEISTGKSSTSGKNGGKKGTKRPAAKTSATVKPKSEVKSAKATNQDSSSKPQHNMEMEQRFDAMLQGDLSDLPPLPRSIVRIFLSSTFSDMRAERNALSTDVSPVLRDYCGGEGLEFQLVDLRWGLTEDAANDHSAEKLCLREVQNCQDVSLGPNFISILSERYGFRPIPTEIPCSEFTMLRGAATELGLDVALLDMWYMRDDNAIPTEYVLQPIRSQFTNFGNMSVGDAERQHDKAAWQKTFSDIQTIVRQSADVVFKKGRMSEEQRHKYFVSVTESETAKGIYEADHPKTHCLFYHRKLTGMTDVNLYEQDAGRYVNIVTTGDDKSVNSEVKELQEAAIARIKKVLGPGNCTSFNVPWKSGGIDPSSNPPHKTYISNFCDKLTSDVMNMIDQAKNKRSSDIRQQEYYCVLDETLHHLKFCQTKCLTFCGQEDILTAVKKYILSAPTRQPLIISAESGAGKTSVMAMIMKKLHSWLKGDYIGMIKFLGTSPETLNIYDVIFSICGQLADCTDTIMEPMGYKNMDTLLDYFPRFLRNMASAYKAPIVILLDSIDQLSHENGAYSMNWLPSTLPQNVRIIISTLPKEHKILSNIKKKFPDASNYLEIPVLPESTGRQIIDKYLKIRKRKVTDDQVKHILATFAKAASPLYLKLLLDEAVKWSSFSPASEMQLAVSIRAAIDVLFDRLEKKFGKVLVQHALGYITIGLNGLSEIELEDALSCDNQALDEVYQFHDPPVPGFVRIPSVLWARIRYDIKEYLVDRMSQNKTTMFWYHRQFIEAAGDRYVQGDVKNTLHLTLLEVYMAETGVKKDVYLSKRKKNIDDADRQVTPQPTKSRNTRKLACLTHHLNKVAEVADPSLAKGQVYCNFVFLSTLLSAFSRDTVVKNMEEYLYQKDDEEIRTVKTFLESNQNKLTVPVVFAGSILAHIRPSSDCSYLKQLHSSASSFLSASDKTLLIPTFPCLATKSPNLTTHSLLDNTKTSCFVFRNNQQLVTAGHDGKLALWSLDNGRVEKVHDVEFMADEIHLTVNDSVLLLNKEKKEVRWIHLVSGEFMVTDVFPTGVESLTLSKDKAIAYIVTKDTKVSLHQMDLNTKTLKRSTVIQKMFDFVNIKTVLSASDRYLVFQAQVTQDDYEAIKASWKKSGGFAKQEHPYRFAAVDLEQITGTLQLCLRIMSTIPMLGETIAPHRGNTMLVATRRHGVYWDIPTGKCDQQMSKGKKIPMIYRPQYIGVAKCTGANTCFVQPLGQEFVAVGSQDGYLFVYNFQSGLPVGMKAPPTKHNTEVRLAAVSANAKVVASVCAEGVLKLWSPVTGLEVFSLQLRGQVTQMTFTLDSLHLVLLLTQGQTSRILVFNVKLGK